MYDSAALDGTRLENRGVLISRKPDATSSLIPMHQPSTAKSTNETQETEKVPFLVVKRIREAILDEVFKPGDHLGEVERRRNSR